MRRIRRRIGCRFEIAWVGKKRESLVRSLFTPRHGTDNMTGFMVGMALHSPGGSGQVCFYKERGGCVGPGVSWKMDNVVYSGQ